jgi:2-dehydro-3-deoxyphosphogalactonate aldolase
MDDLDHYAHALPLVAILRGVQPEEAVGIGQALVDAGFRLLEVPLNSPQPFESIARLVRAFGNRALIGAGTVLARGDVDRIAEAGGRLCVMPHGDLDVIHEAKRQDLICLPGVATPTEAFRALEAGADALKLFPAEMITPPVLKAMRAVLPRSARLFPVGGITPNAMAPYIAAGANGFGLGSALYRPGMQAAEVAHTAADFATAWQALHTL